jgi:hypothetical protein
VNELNSREIGVRGSRGWALLKAGFAAGTLLAFAGISQAQVLAPADDALTMKGITLYGIVDIGLQYESHGAPFSDFFPAGSADIVQKNSTGRGLVRRVQGRDFLQPAVGRNQRRSEIADTE